MKKEQLQTVGISLIIALMGVAAIGLIIIGNTIASHGQRVYNCSIVEISPDFTPKMRDECRKLRKDAT